MVNIVCHNIIITVIGVVMIIGIALLVEVIKGKKLQEIEFSTKGVLRILPLGWVIGYLMY